MKSNGVSWSIAVMSVKAVNGSIQSFLPDNRHSAYPPYLPSNALIVNMGWA